LSPKIPGGIAQPIEFVPKIPGGIAQPIEFVPKIPGGIAQPIDFKDWGTKGKLETKVARLQGYSPISPPFIPIPLQNLTRKVLFPYTDKVSRCTL
jgi:hypothetical protein